MSPLRRISLLAATVLAALAVTAPAHAAPALTAQAGGVKVTACSVKYVLTFRLFTRGISCGRAFTLVNATASSDRWCPKGWKTRARVKLNGANGDQADPTVTLCTKGDRAFTYNVPTG